MVEPARGVPDIPAWRRRRSRSMAAGRRGMVATGHALATLVGAQVLREGGNAVDAAIAAAGVLAVVQPMMNGLGGDAFMIVFDARRDELWAVNGSGAAPRGATREFFVGQGYARMPLDGVVAASVPGAVDAYVTALERWGTMRLRDLWRPAIAYAAEGFAVTERVALWTAQEAERLRRFPNAAAIYLPGGAPPQVGDVLVQRDLARSLERVAEGGRDAFYRGELARRIADYCARHGGLLTLEDLAEHQSEVYRPIAGEYRGLTVYVTAPPSQGFLLLEALHIVEGFDLAALGPDAAAAVHLCAEAIKLAFADRNAYFGDPRFVANPLAQVLDKEFARRRRQAIDPERAAQRVEGAPELVPAGDTTYLCAVDRWGNAVSLITSISHAFGCADVVEGTGILLNNRAGRGFNLVEGHPNCIAPGKRTMHTLNCFMVFRDDRPYLVGGTPGGDGQPQWNLQVLSRVIDHGYDVQAAVDAPRWTVFPGSDPAHLDRPFELRVEDAFPESTLQGLEERGHRVVRVPYLYGGGGFQLIACDRERGVYLGGSDPRVDGCALGI